MKNILILLTNHATLGTTDEANGTYAPELTHALHEFKAANFTYDFVSIQGGKAPLYGIEDNDDAAHLSIINDNAFHVQLENTKSVQDVDVASYDAVFYPGGFGLLSDLNDNQAAAKLTADIYQKGGVIGAVCHGPAGLLPITLDNGEKLLANKSVTAFCREEEVAAGTIDKVPFVLEDAIEDIAGSYKKAAEWQEYVIEDNRVITGQNPASAHGVGKKMVELLA